MTSKVFMICDAYESGVGHGLQRDGMDESPFGNIECAIAYQIGYALGLERAPQPVAPAQTRRLFEGPQEESLKRELKDQSIHPEYAKWLTDRAQFGVEGHSGNEIWNAAWNRRTPQPVAPVEQAEMSNEAILKLICDNTGKRINLPNFTLDELMELVRAAIAASNSACAENARTELIDASKRSDGKDAERLDFVLSNSAFILRTKADSGVMTYQLETQDEDENYVMLSGEDRFFPTPRAAIDAAIERG